MIDSVALIRESHRHAVRTVLGEEWPDERLVANVGRPLLEQMQAFSAERAEELYRVYRVWNHAHTADLLLAYDGIEQTLVDLRSAGRRLGIVTSKSHDAVALAFGVLPWLAGLFDVVIAAEDSVRHKPEPDPILEGLHRLGAGTEGACYVGDAPFDIRAGKAAGVTTIGVPWGFFPRAVLTSEEPDAMAETPADLARMCLEGL